MSSSSSSLSMYPEEVPTVLVVAPPILTIPPLSFRTAAASDGKSPVLLAQRRTPTGGAVTTMRGLIRFLVLVIVVATSALLLSVSSCMVPWFIFEISASRNERTALGFVGCGWEGNDSGTGSSVAAIPTKSGDENDSRCNNLGGDDECKPLLPSLSNTTSLSKLTDWVLVVVVVVAVMAADVACLSSFSFAFESSCSGFIVAVSLLIAGMVGTVVVMVVNVAILLVCGYRWCPAKSGCFVFRWSELNEVPRRFGSLSAL